MKESMWGTLIVGLGIIIVIFLFVIHNLTTTNEQDYHLSREVLKSSMFDAVDYGTYAKSGRLVISKEKFVSIFTRRFAESVTPDRTYTLYFYDIHEYPPKATVRIKTDYESESINDSSNPNTKIDINTYITGILETNSDGGELELIYTAKYGDLDSDNQITRKDVTKLTDHLSGRIELTDAQILAADVNLDGNINEKDLEILNLYLTDKDKCPELPCVKN